MIVEFILVAQAATATPKPTTAEEAVASFEGRFGSHDGFRRLHAKGWLYRGSFTATPAAASLTRASIFTSRGSA